MLFAGVAVLLLVLAAIVEHSDCAPLAGTKNDTKRDEELFEGDIVISEEMIRHYYNITDYELKTGEKFRNRTRTERGATSVSSKLWPDGIVYYTFDSSLPASSIRTIRNAMNYYQNRTCLRFIERRARNHIKFVSEFFYGCRSFIGMIGGEQKLWLRDPGCTSLGTALHEIGHAIGFWHEQSRPDRDSYVNIISSNFRSRYAINFMKRNIHDIDSLGMEYDYGSIMHYSSHAFSRNGQPTIQVNNPTVYANQGRPTLGQNIALSAKDIKQVNYLYKCPGIGVLGRLRIKVRNARNLFDTNPLYTVPDPYVKITAVYSRIMVKKTTIKSHTMNPTWNEYFDFGVQYWKYFRVQIWDNDGYNADDIVSFSQIITPTTCGTEESVKHCTPYPRCIGYLWFDYYLCPSGRAGSNCAHKWANLQFFIRYGRNLQDRDGLWDTSDPYVEVIAYNIDGQSVRRATSIKHNNENPIWNEILHFGSHGWEKFHIRVWESDWFFDEGLSSQQLVHIKPGYHCSIIHRCYKGGYIKYDYRF